MTDEEGIKVSVVDVSVTDAIDIDGFSADVSVTDEEGIKDSVVDVSVTDAIEIGETSADVSVIHGAEIQVSSDFQMNNVTDDFNINMGDLK